MQLPRGDGVGSANSPHVPATLNVAFTPPLRPALLTEASSTTRPDTLYLLKKLQQIVEGHALEANLHLAPAVGLQPLHSEAIGFAGLTECVIRLIF